MSKHTQKIQYGQHNLILETGEIARQADAAVMVNMEGTQVLVTVVGKKTGAEANDFFPLTVNYQEKIYAIGKIPGGYNKREGRPSEVETLTSRLIDRPIRPLFPNGFNHEVQIIATVVSLNPDIAPDIPAIIGASAALAISGLPFQGPIGAARVGYSDGIYLLNPSHASLKTSQLDLVVAGTKDAILMVESEAKELSESIMLGAVLFGHEMMQVVIEGINQLAQKSTKPAFAWSNKVNNQNLLDFVMPKVVEVLTDAYAIADKATRYAKLQSIRADYAKSLAEENVEFTQECILTCIHDIEAQLVRKRILDGLPRIDGRDRYTVRPIAIKPSILERVHGSVLFTRGETQALVIATLGNERDAQMIDGLGIESKDRFMLHYNFPPYSVGEVGMVGSPKRREIGHGKLAKRALQAVLPNSKDFPYVLRVVSEITESNGSSSMASVCGASLALMDAGVPIKSPVAGVAMGLIKEGDKFAILTDILGDEDHLGDMDFKVAGTINGVTALQMDIKISGITKNIMAEALEQAEKGRMHILNIMNNSLPESRKTLSAHAPRIETMTVPEDKIRTIIGKGGVTIKALIEQTGVTIDIDDSGLVQLFSPNQEALEEAKSQIKSLIAEIEVGHTYNGKVIRIVEYGAFVNLLPGKDGLLHVSQICNNRNQKVESVLQENQEIEVYVAGVDKQGRVKLEWKNKPEVLSPAEDESVVEPHINAE